MKHHALFRWALLGCTVLWLTVASATVAPAAYTNYVLDPGGVFSGTFTMDPIGVEAVPFDDWAFNSIYSGLATPATYPSTANSFNLPFYNFLQVYDGSQRINFVAYTGGVYTPGTYQIEFLQPIGTTGQLIVRETGTYQAVPEPAAIILLATGLLVLAGSRWLPRRGAWQQLG